MTDTFRGYDPSLERLDDLLANAQTYAMQGQRCAMFAGKGDVNKRMPIEAQGNWPSCGGHAGSTLAEYLHWLKTGEIIHLSRMFAWVEAQRVHGRPSARNGVSIYALVKVLKEIGVPKEDLAEYRVGNWYDDFGRDVYADAKTRVAEHSYKLKTAEEVWDFQNAGMGGVVWGVPWEFNMRSWHAVTSYGPAEEFLLGDNSWGPDWDDDGRFEWDRGKVKRYLAKNGTVCVGLSDLSSPQVRQDNNWRDEVMP